MELEQRDSLPDLFPCLLDASENYLRQLGLQDLQPLRDTDIQHGQLELEDVTAFIQVSGGIQGGFIFSVDHAVSRKLAKLFMLEEINDVEAGQYAVEVVAEVANIVTAHSLHDRDEENLFLGNPLMILSRDMGLRASSYQSKAFSTADGRFRWMYIPMMEKAELASIVTVRNSNRNDSQEA